MRAMEFVVVLVLAAIALVPMLAPPANDQTEGRFVRMAVRLDRMEAADAELKARVVSLESHVAELACVSHDRRKALADELRRETAKAAADLRAEIAAVRSDVAAQVVIRGQQTNGERSARRREIQEAAREVVGLTAALLEEQGVHLLTKIDRIEKRLKAAESRPVPAPAVVEKVVQVPVCVPAPAPVLVPVHVPSPPCRLIPILPRRFR